MQEHNLQGQAEWGKDFPATLFPLSIGQNVTSQGRGASAAPGSGGRECIRNHTNSDRGNRKIYAEKELWRSLLQPPAQSKASFKVRSGCLGPRLVKFWVFPRMEISPPLWVLFQGCTTPTGKTSLLTFNQNLPCCTLPPLPLIPSLGITTAWLHLLRTPPRNCRQQREPPLSLLPAEEASSQTLLLCPMLQPQPSQCPPLDSFLPVTALDWGDPDWTPSPDASQVPKRGEGPHPWGPAGRAPASTARDVVGRCCSGHLLTPRLSPGPPGPFLQSCSPAVQALPALEHRVILSLVQDFTFIVSELHKVPVSHLLQPVKVSLSGRSALRQIPNRSQSLLSQVRTDPAASFSLSGRTSAQGFLVPTTTLSQGQAFPSTALQQRSDLPTGSTTSALRTPELPGKVFEIG